MIKKFISTLLSFFIVLLISTEGLFVNAYNIMGIAFYRWLELLIFLYLIKDFLLTFKTNHLFRLYIYILIYFYIFLLFKIIIIFIYQLDIESESMRQIFRIPFYVIVPYLIFYAIKQNLNNLKIILFILIIIYTVAFFEFPVTPFTDLAWHIRFDYFGYNVDPSMEHSMLKTRVSALYSYAIPFTYSLISAGILTTYLFIKTENMLYFIVLIFIGIVGAMSLTRSVMIGIVILLLFLIFLRNKKRNNSIKYLVSIIIIFVIGMQYLNNIDSFSRLSTDNDKSAQGRLPLAITGIYAVTMNPLGISQKHYQDYKQEMYLIYKNDNILYNSSHNGLLNLAFEYSLLALIVFLLCLYYFHKYIYKYNDTIRKFIIISIIAYLSHAMLHNNFIFIKDFSIFIFVGIIFYEDYLNSSNKQLNSLK